MKEEFKQTEIGKAILINPKRELKKGTIAKKVSMDKLNTFTKKVQSFEITNFKGGSKFVNGDTLLARITPCLENGKTAYVDFLEKKEIGFGSTEFIILSGKDGETINEFVYYLAISPKFREQAISSMTGTSGRQRVQNDFLAEKEIEIPSIQEQTAIAKILSSLDEKIELNNKINKNLEAIGQALFKKWFIDEAKEDWEESIIGKEVKTILGGTPSRVKPEYWSGNINWINSGKVNEFRITAPSEKITEEGLRKSATSLLPKGTVVLAITGATLGQVSRLEIDSCANQSVIGVLENENFSSEYLYYLIKNNIGEIIGFQTGGAQQHINKGNVDNFRFIVPDKKTLQDFNNQVKPIFKQISVNCFENKNLSQIRDSLLPKLMSGEIRVK